MFSIFSCAFPAVLVSPLVIHLVDQYLQRSIVNRTITQKCCRAQCEDGDTRAAAEGSSWQVLWCTDEAASPNFDAHSRGPINLELDLVVGARQLGMVGVHGV